MSDKNSSEVAEDDDFGKEARMILQQLSDNYHMELQEYVKNGHITADPDLNESIKSDSSTVENVPVELETPSRDPSPRATVMSKLGFMKRFKPWNSKRDIATTAVFLVVFVAVRFIHGLAVSYTDRLYNSPFAQRAILSDVVMRQTFSWFLSSGLPINLPWIVTLVSTILLFLRAISLKQESCKIMRRLLLILSLAYLIRSAFILLTLIPSPNVDCRASPASNLAVDAIILIFSGRSTCGDIFFSGNAVILTTCTLTWIARPVNINKATRWLSIILIAAVNTFGLVMLVITTNQYTISVVAAVWITASVWLAVWSIATVKLFSYSRGPLSIMGRLEDDNWHENATIFRLQQEIQANSKQRQSVGA